MTPERQNPFRTPEGKVKLRDRLSPEIVIEREPADAREMAGQWPERYEMVEADALSVREVMADMPMDLLDAVARCAGIGTHNEHRTYLVQKLTPLVERREVRLPVIGKLKGGQRAEVLVRLTRQMRRRGMEPKAIETALLEENRRRCQPPLPEAEVRKVAATQFEPEDPADEPDFDVRLFAGDL